MPTHYQPILQFHSNNRDMILYEDITICFAWKDKMYRITAFKGFNYDGASIPQTAWSLIGSPFVGEYRVPTFWHDVCYRCIPRELMSRADADSILEMLMDDEREDSFTSAAVYQAVDWFGGSAWDKCTAKLEDNLKFAEIEITPL